MALLQDYNKLFEYTDNIKKIYLNNSIVWPTGISSTPPGPDYTEPFYVENISNENETLSIVKSDSSAPTLEIEYSTDKATWNTFGTTSTTALTRTLAPGEKVYLRCSTNAWWKMWSSNSILGISKVGGNIMSLLYGSNFTGQERSFPSNSRFNFGEIFNDYILISASELLLPATTLADGCYCYMFDGCISLITAPALPATTLAQSCYGSMFWGCTALRTAPELPATTLANGCYSGMFGFCTALTTAPELPATTLANNCYSEMFTGCTSLTTAPALPATTLTQNCYSQMFQRCTLLNNVTCLATSGIDTNYSTFHWLNNVSATGTFTKAAGVTWSTGVNGIPEGWTVVEQ